MSRYPGEEAPPPHYPAANGVEQQERNRLRQQCHYLEDQLRTLQLMSKSQTALLRTNLLGKLEERDELVGRACRVLAETDAATAGQIRTELQRLQDVSLATISNTAVTQLQQEVDFLREQNRKLLAEIDEVRRAGRARGGGNDPAGSVDDRVASLENDKRQLMALLHEARNKLGANLSAAPQAPTLPAPPDEDSQLAAARAEIERLQLTVKELADKNSSDAAIAAAALSAAESEAAAARTAALGEADEARQQLQEALAREQAAHAHTRDEHAMAMEEVRKTGDTLTMLADHKAELEADKAALSKQVKKLRKQSNNTGKAMAPLRRHVSALKTSNQALKDEAETCLRQALPELMRQAADHIQGAVQASVAGLSANYRRELTERKRLFNLVQELRGNIRVFCRARPPTKTEQSRGEADMGAVCVSFPEEGAITVVNDRAKEKTWEFDQVFGFETTQAVVYDQISPLVTSVLDGYNVTIFAYGQTGSGKTFTMMGPPDNRGVNTRTLDELFTKSQARASEVHDTVQVSILEIYCEQIRDMLATDAAAQRLEVRQSDRGNYVPGLTWVPVTSMAEVLELLALADQNRSTASTNMNEHSSRSHLLLSVQVESVNVLSGQRTWGKLHLVDLAGSERISKSGAEGQALKEAQAINKSLSALGDVIMSRMQKSSHVPFRNSTLTHLLQDSLSGDSKTLMFVCLSPVMFNAEETFCSLNFAARVRTVELGRAQRNASSGGSSRSRRAAR